MKKKTARVIFVFTAFVILLLRIIFFIFQHRVNIYFSDEWLVNEVFSHQPSLWSLITAKYAGDMLQGPSYVMTYVLALVSNFNAQAEEWHTLFYFVVACLLFLVISAKTKRISLFDAVIPLLFFSFRGYEVFVIDSQAPYVSFPFVLLGCISYFWLVPWGAVRVGLTLLLFGMLVHSGYGWALIPGFLIVACFEHIRLRNNTQLRRYSTALLAGGIAIVVLFLNRFTYQSCMDGNLPFPDNIPASVAAYLFHFVGYYMVGSPLVPFLWQDIVVTVLLFGFAIYALYLMLSKKQSVYTIAFLGIAHTLGFILINSFGRTCFGLVQVQSPRYSIQFIPLMIGMVLIFKQIKQAMVRVILLLLLVCFLIYKEVAIYSTVIRDVGNKMEQKQAVRACTRSGNSLASCVRTVDCYLCTNVVTEEDAAKVNAFEQFLKTRKANLYAR